MKIKISKLTFLQHQFPLQYFNYHSIDLFSSFFLFQIQSNPTSFKEYFVSNFQFDKVNLIIMISRSH